MKEIPGRIEVIEKFKSSNGKVAAVYPYHYHKALFRAFNILPVEVWDPFGVDGSFSSNYLQSYVCSIVHSGLAFFNAGKLDIVDFIVVPHTCDSLQGLGSVFIDFVKPRQPVFTIYIPRGEGKLGIEFLAGEFRYIYDRLVRITGKRPSNGELMSYIEREERAFELSMDLYNRREELSLGDVEFYKLIRSREYLPTEDFIETVENVLRESSDSVRDGIPIVISGLVLKPESIVSKIGNLGGRIVWDDLACCGRRLYPKGYNSDPFIRMAESVINGPVEPSKGSSVNDRFNLLKGVIEKTKAKGIIFYIIKFCEMELFYLPYLSKELRNFNINSIFIETDVNEPLSGQALTRLEAFFETIS